MKFVFTILTVFIFLQSRAQFIYHWKQITGPIQAIIADPDSANTEVSGLNQVGIYQFEFSVTNEFGTGKDTCKITVISGALSIQPDSVFHLQRPRIKKLEIKAIARSSDIFIQIKSPRMQTITCVLYDAIGRALAKIDMKVNEGTNYITIPKPHVVGVYIIQFQTYFDVITQKVVF